MLPESHKVWCFIKFGFGVTQVETSIFYLGKETHFFHISLVSVKENYVTAFFMAPDS